MHERQLQDAADAAAAEASSDVDSGLSGEESSGPVEYASELHQQLATLRVDPAELEGLGLLKEQVEASMAAATAGGGVEVGAPGNDGWEAVPVKPRRKDADAFRELAVPKYNAAQQDRCTTVLSCFISPFPIINLRAGGARLQRVAAV